MKNLVVALVLVVLTFPAWKGMRHIGMVSGHDAEAAVFKIGEFYNALKDGQFPVRWAKRLDYGLGQPTFTFTYTMPYYITSIFVALGATSLWAYKLLMMLSFPIGAWGLYMWLKDKIGDWPALASAVTYAYFPYHLANVYVRGAIGEVAALAFLPWSMYTLDRIGQKSDWGRVFGAAVAIAIVILSHQFYGLIFGSIWLGYGVVKREKRIIWAVVWGYVLCSFYIIPAFAYKDLTYLRQIGEYFLRTQYFATIPKLIYSPWGYAAYQEIEKDPMSIQIGWAGLLGIIGLGIGAKKLNEAKYYLGVGIVMLFLMLPVSLEIWKILTPLQALQFPWRLLGVVSLVASYGVGLLVSKIKQGWWGAGIVIVLVIVTNYGYAKVQRYDLVKDPTLVTIGYPGTLTMLLEETPIWHNIKQEANPYNYATVTDGDAEAVNLVWKTNYHRMEVVAQNDSVVNDKTHYWPGWEVTVDGKKVELIDPMSKLSQGVLAFKVGTGTHLVESRLKEPGINKAGNLISLLALGVGLATVGKLVISSKHANK